MFRFIITMMWGILSACIVLAADVNLFTSIASVFVLAALLGFSLWSADTVRIRSQTLIQRQRLFLRLPIWFLLYELVPATLLILLAALGLFVLPHGLVSALIICVPISVITLRDYVDLNWLAR
jgi:hypothetical protein